LIARIVILYARVLVIVQGLFIMGLLWLATLHAGGGGVSPMAYVFLGAIATVVTAVSVTGIVAALLMRPGRRWAPIAVIILEALWTTVSLKSAVADRGGTSAGQLYAAGVLSLAAIIGLLMPPARAYCGLMWRLR